jgi:hypothetical protein
VTGGERHRSDLSDVQRRGVAAAMEVFDGLIEELDGFDGRPRADAALDGRAGGGPSDFPQLRAAVARTVDVYAELFRRTVEVYADVVESVLRSNGSAPEADGRGAEIALAGAAGGEALAAVWIHNTTAAPVEAVMLRMTDLTAHDGTRIAAASASFAPERLDVGPGASRSSALSVRVPRSTPPATYVGHVLATGLPGTRLAVCLVVAP